LPTAFTRGVLGALASHLLLSAGIASSGDPVQGGSDWFDVLSATSVLGGFELLDKMRAGWACAVDIHKVERRPGEGIK
jgi:hypothetical protein